MKKLLQFIKWSGNITTTDDLDIYWITWKDIKKHKDNMMYFLWASSAHSADICKRFLDTLPKQKLTKIKKEWIKEGFHVSPAGLSELVFITNPVDESRVKRAFFVFETLKNGQIFFKIKNTNLTYKIDKNKVLPSLRTITGIRNMDITNINDYIILNGFQGFDIVLKLGLSKWKESNKFSWELVKKKSLGKETYLAISRRFNLYSPNTSLFAFYGKNKFIPPDTLKILPVFSKSEAKIQCLFLNSIINILQILSNKEETTGEYGTIRGTELLLFYIFDLNKLTIQDKNLLDDLFKNIHNVKFPSVLQQLENRFWARVELDKTILKILGFTDREINEWLPKVYDVIVEELKIMKKVR